MEPSKKVLSQRIDAALFEEVKKYAGANTGKQMRIATERLLRLGLDSLNNQTPKCPSCGEPLSVPYWLCKKEGKVIREVKK